jgi:UDP-N-acetylglucosamine 2-epimerase
MKRVCVIVGTRPEVIKMVPVYRKLCDSPSLVPLLVSTGQHREMLAQAFNTFGIEPDVDLGLMTPGQSLTKLTARVMSALSDFWELNKVDCVLVQGDTSTVLAASIAAAYAGIPIGHIEAGLRTYNMSHPFPEELNRRLVSPAARWHFVPTSAARSNLLSERISPDSIYITGNTVIDALLEVRTRLSADQSRDRTSSLGINSSFASQFFDRFSNTESRSRSNWILVTGHRRESFGEGFTNICKALLEIVNRFPDIGVVYPVHLNPQVRGPVIQLLGGHPRIALIEPVGYEDFVWLMQHCRFILTDSGGVQEEAPSLGKPVLVLRETTERPEGVEAGTSLLVGTDPESIIAESSRLIMDEAEFSRRSSLKNPFGDGNAAGRIVGIIERELK